MKNKLLSRRQFVSAHGHSRTLPAAAFRVPAEFRVQHGQLDAVFELGSVPAASRSCSPSGRQVSAGSRGSSAYSLYHSHRCRRSLTSFTRAARTSPRRDAGLGFLSAMNGVSLRFILHLTFPFHHTVAG